MSILVSIIIPIHNTESYLRQTLDSVKVQTYSNMEVLLIDDGSTDDSPRICDEYADKDDRFRVYHISQSGVANARNFALAHIRGEYCAFVDSDDLIKPDYIEVMVSVAERYDAKLVECRRMHGLKHRPSEFESYETNKMPSIEELSLNEYRYTNKYSHVTVWAALYKTTLLEGVNFDSSLYVGEDTLFFAECLYKARRLLYINEIYYYYTYRGESILRGEYNEKRHTEIESWKRVCGLFKDEEKSFANECHVALAIRCKKNFPLAVKNHKRTLSKELHLLGLRQVKHVVLSKEMSRKAKVKYCLFAFFPYVFNRH